MTEYRYTYEHHLLEATYCDACKAIPWERLFQEAFTTHKSRAGMIEQQAYDPVLARYWVHNTQTSFRDAVQQQKCDFCAMLWQVWVLDCENLLEESRGIELLIYLSDGRYGKAISHIPSVPYILIEFGIPKQALRGYRLPQGFTLELSPDHPAGKHLKNRVIPVDPLSAATVATIKRWLYDCCNGHDECQETQDCSSPLVLPARLLDIGRNGSLLSRLVESTELDHPSQYAALSHCWGTQQNFSLQHGNISHLKSGVINTHLPCTFQDAISVCHQLDIEYLWIDSLCIIQDDTDDWRRESASMGSVYKNAYLTIAASRASSDVEGFLSPRVSTSRVGPLCKLPQRSYEFSDGVFLTNDVPDFDEDLVTSPWFERAWVTQERYLSRRTLAYTKSGLIWSCRTVIASEHGDATSKVEDSLNWVIKSIKSGSWKTVSRGAKHFHLQTSYDLWYKMITVFSACGITKTADRLPALAGMVSEIASQTGHHYYAGLWEHDMFRGLSWEAAQGGRRLGYYRAPTWSWASLEGTVWHSYGYKSLRNLATIISVSTEFNHLSPYGAVSGGKVVLSAHLTHVDKCTTFWNYPQTFNILFKLHDKWFISTYSHDVEVLEQEQRPLWLLLLDYCLKAGQSTRLVALVVSSEVSGNRERVGIVRSMVAEIMEPAKFEEYTADGRRHELNAWRGLLRTHDEQSWCLEFLQSLPKETVTLV